MPIFGLCLSDNLKYISHIGTLLKADFVSLATHFEFRCPGSLSYIVRLRTCHIVWPTKTRMLRDTAPLMSCAKDQDTWRVRFQQVFFALTTVYTQESSISQPHVKYVSTLLPPHNLLLCFPTICVNLVWKGVNWILNIEAGIHT